MAFKERKIIFIFLVLAWSQSCLCAVNAQADSASKRSIGEKPAHSSADRSISEDPAPSSAERSIDALVDDGSSISNHFQMAGDYALRNDQIEQAIATTRKSLRRDPDNIQAHECYAEALDRKIQTLKNTDAELKRECISEWLIVYRSEVGEEKGLGFHGISPMGHLFEDDGYAIRARHRLIAIAGRAPHPWETNARYLKSVLRHASVSGQIIDRK